MSDTASLPQDWRLTTLEEVTAQGAPIRYGVVQIGPDTPGGVPIVPIKHINRITSASLHRAGKEIERKYSGSRIQGGDVLISVKGTIGQVGIVPAGFEGNIAREIARIRPKINIDGRYLAFQLQSPSTQRKINASTVGSTRLEFSIHAVRQFEIPLPPLSEQKKIADILSTWDTAIDTTEKLLAHAEMQKRALMEQLLTGKRRLRGFEEEWAQRKIGSLLKEVRRTVQWSDDETYRLVSIRRRSGGAFLREELKGSDILTKTMKTTEAGDFLISKMQVVHGAMAMTPPDLDGCHISGSYISLVARDNAPVLIAYFDWLSRTRRMYRKAFLSSYGVHVEKMTFNLDWFFDEQLTLPATVVEQRAIVEILNDADACCANLARQCDHLIREKRALMQQLLTGKRRVAA